MPRAGVDIAKLRGARVDCFMLAELEFVTHTSRVFTGEGKITWNGVDWYGVGDLGSLGPMTETTEVRADGLTLGLSGIPHDNPITGDPIDVLGDMLAECRQGNQVKLYMGLFDPDDGTILQDPALTWAGRMDAAGFEEGMDSSTAKLNAESPLFDLNRSREYRYTDECQKSFYPTDRAGEYVTAIQELNLMWGRAAIPSGVGGGSPGPYPDPDTIGGKLPSFGG